LIKSGAFDCLDSNRNKLFNSIDMMLNYSQSIQKDKIANQDNLFNHINGDELSIDIPNILDWSAIEKLNNEFTSLGMYLSSHPLNNFSIVLKSLNVINSSELLENSQKGAKKNIQLCGLIFKVQRRLSSRGKWAVLELNDLGGNCEVILYSDILYKYESLLDEKKPILIDAEIKNEVNQGIRIIAKRLRNFDEYITNSKFNLTLSISDLSCIKIIKLNTEKLNVGPSFIDLEFLVDGSLVNIKIKENIKFTQDFLNAISIIKGIKSINYS
jgi:DNA polymerase-3 subunit alpha